MNEDNQNGREPPVREPPVREPPGREPPIYRRDNGVDQFVSPVTGRILSNGVEAGCVDTPQINMSTITATAISAATVSSGTVNADTLNVTSINMSSGGTEASVRSTKVVFGKFSVSPGDGVVDVGGYTLTGLPLPSGESDAASKSYVDTAIVPLATKAYVDSSISSLHITVDNEMYPLATKVYVDNSVSTINSSVNNLTSTVSALSGTVTSLGSSVATLGSTVTTTGTNVTTLSNRVGVLETTVSGLSSGGGGAQLDEPTLYQIGLLTTKTPIRKYFTRSAPSAGEPDFYSLDCSIPASFTGDTRSVDDIRSMANATWDLLSSPIIPGAAPISLYTQESILAANVFTISSKKVKKVIDNSNDKKKKPKSLPNTGASMADSNQTFIDALAFFDQLNLTKYEYVDQSSYGTGINFGVIAEEVSEIQPGWVNNNNRRYIPNIVQAMDAGVYDPANNTSTISVATASFLIKDGEGAPTGAVLSTDDEIRVVGDNGVLYHGTVKSAGSNNLLIQWDGSSPPAGVSLTLYGTKEVCPCVDKTKLHDLAMTVTQYLLAKIRELESEIKTLKKRR